MSTSILTPRETEIVTLVATGATNQEIANVLLISERTARTHVSNILAKLGLANRTALTLWAIDHGLADAIKNNIAEESTIDPLTEREKEIAEHIAQGWKSQMIADLLALSERTVRCHISNILAKLNLSNRREIALWYNATYLPV